MLKNPMKFNRSTFAPMCLTLCSGILLSGCGSSDDAPEPVIPPASASISLSPNVTSDDEVSRLEISTGSDVAISGTTGGDVADGDTVTLTINAKSFTGTVSNGAFSINVPISDLEADSDLTIDASVTTSTGNVNGEASASDSDPYTLEPSISAGIGVDDITTDNEISQAEIISANDINVTGSVSGDVSDTDTISLSINNKTFIGTASNSNFSIAVPVADFKDDQDTSLSLTVTTSTGNSAGEQSASITKTYTIEPEISASITLSGNISDDDIITQAEIDAGNPIAVSGTVGGDVAAGDTVTLTVNGKTYQGIVTSGAFSIDVPIADLEQDDDLTVEVSVITSTGNSAGEKTATANDTYTIGVEVAAGELIDPSPGAGNRFGDSVLMLKNGNVVVTSPFDSTNARENGAVHLYDGSTRNIIASFYGNVDDEQIGKGGITELENGNFVISSPNDTNASGTRSGAIKIINGETGIQVGTDLTGARSTDALSSGGVTALKNSSTSNFVVSSPSYAYRDNNIISPGLGGIVPSRTRARAGHFMVVNGDTGEIVGSPVQGVLENDFVSSGGIQALENGHFVVSSPNFNTQLTSGVILQDAGAVAVYSGIDGSLIGDKVIGASSNDRLSSGGVLVLENDNIVISSPLTDKPSLAPTKDSKHPSMASLNHTSKKNAISNDTDIGEVFLMSGTTGLKLSGNFRGESTGDQYGINLAKLSNGNYLAWSITANEFNGTKFNVGVVSLFDGSDGSRINSVFGANSNDALGSMVTVLPNGNYVISSSSYGSNGLLLNGRVELRNGVNGAMIGTPIAGSVNSERFGDHDLIALENSNYIISTTTTTVNSELNAGSAVLVNGATGVEITRISGDIENDQLGVSGIVPLNNGNFVIATETDDIGTIINAGTVTLHDGTSGAQIGITHTTSQEDIFFSNGGVVALSNNNFVVTSIYEEVNNVDRGGSIRLYNGSSGQFQGITLYGTARQFFEASTITNAESNYHLVSSPYADKNAMSNSGYVAIVKNVLEGKIALKD